MKTYEMFSLSRHHLRRAGKCEEPNDHGLMEDKDGYRYHMQLAALWEVAANICERLNKLEGEKPCDGQ